MFETINRWLRPPALVSRVDRFIARFERERDEAGSQAELDEANGRLAYWQKAKARG